MGDVYRSLKLAVESLRCNDNQQHCKTICRNIAAGLLVPLAMTIIVIFADYGLYIPEAYQPKLGCNGKGLCWFKNNAGLLIYFVTPFAAMMSLNIFLFILSAKMIYGTTSNSANMSTCAPKTNFYLYLRLGIIVGLTWCVG